MLPQIHSQFDGSQFKMRVCALHILGLSCVKLLLFYSHWCLYVSVGFQGVISLWPLAHIITAKQPPFDSLTSQRKARQRKMELISVVSFLKVNTARAAEKMPPGDVVLVCASVARQPRLLDWPGSSCMLGCRPKGEWSWSVVGCFHWFARLGEPSHIWCVKVTVAVYF